MDNKDFLIVDPNARQARIEEKTRLILDFLVLHTWSTPAILANLLGVRSMRVIHKTVERMRKEGLVAVETIENGWGRFNLIGLTIHGATEACDHELPTEHTWNRSKVPQSTFMHRLDIQLIHSELAKEGWTKWIDPDRKAAPVRQATSWHRPDWVATNLDGKRVGFEAERIYKSIERYRSILRSHFMAIRAGHFSAVVWVCKDSTMARKLYRMFGHITFDVGVEEIFVEGLLDSVFFVTDRDHVVGFDFDISDVM